jgi:hypothetical protein
MTPFQQMLLGSVPSGSKTYLEDVFSSNVWDGDATARKISNGVKLGNSNAGYSVGFDGNGDYLSIGGGTDMELGTGDFTIETFVYFNSVSSGQIYEGRPNGVQGAYISIYMDNNSIVFYTDSATRITSSTLTAKQWYHIAAVRNSSTTTLYIDGTSAGTYADTSDYTVRTDGPVIGISRNLSNNPMNGYISNYRIVKGTAIYTSNFTPSTSALTSTTNTKLLCCNGSSPTSATTAPGTITFAGNVYTEEFGPFTGDDGAGGMVWFKSRSDAYDHYLFNTVAGINSNLSSNTNAAQATTTSGDSNYNNMVTSFDNNGYSLGTSNIVNGSSTEYIGWTFGKKEGFFDIVTWTGTGSYRTLDHNLGCVPGFIMVKKTSGSESWICWHRAMGSGSNAHYLKLDSSAAMGTDGGGGSNPNASVNSVSSTQFTVGADNNGSGGTWVAYLFAGGEPEAATARSLDFTPNAHLTIGDHSDIKPGTSDFTLEAWIKPNTLASGAGFWRTLGGLTISKVSSGNLAISTDGSSTLAASHDPELNVWTHVAVCRSGSTIRMFYNGIQVAEGSNSVDYGGGGTLTAGHTAYYDGSISNLRLVTGTALYTSSFRPTTEPLTNITNTKLLICNNSDPEAGTVLPTTINNSSAVASTNSPFDDSSGFVFGDNNEGIIKCGSYVGNGSDSVDIDIHLGWEPTWLLVKQTTNSGNWQLVDSATHWPISGDWETIRPNLNQAAYFATETGIRLTPTGFKIVKDWGNFNTNGDTHMYMAIRRPDGYVGKAAASGTSVFAMDTASGSTTVPAYISNFVVDFMLEKHPSGTQNWYLSSRLTGDHFLYTNSNSAEINGGGDYYFDSNIGAIKGSWTNNHQGWMWKRHIGFDIQRYVGKTGNQSRAHGLNAVPEMIWAKSVNNAYEWAIGHKDLTSGWTSNHLRFTNSAEIAGQQYALAPTSTHWTTPNGALVNDNGEEYVAMLFSSVEGISKVGSYSGSGSQQTITTGFRPRFLILKNITNTADWYVLDTRRGWTDSPSDEYYLELNTTDAQAQANFGYPVATGFVLEGGNAVFSDSGNTYIYYAHA